MNPPRKHTRAIMFLADEPASPDELLDASQEVVARYLESKGVNLATLDARAERLGKSLGAKVALARASREKLSGPRSPQQQRDLSSMTDADLLNELAKIYGSQEAIPLAARTQQALGRKELESLFRDATDVF